MNNKTIIINDCKSSSPEIELLLHKNLPGFKIIANVKDVQEAIGLTLQEQPEFLFVNANYLNTEQFTEIKRLKVNSSVVLFLDSQLKEKTVLYKKTIKKRDENKLYLKIDNKNEFVNYNNIIRLQAASSYTKFFLKNHEQAIMASRPLKFYVAKLSASKFIRPHRSHLINKKFIKTWVFSNGTIILKDGSTIKIARRKLNTMKEYRISI